MKKLFLSATALAMFSIPAMAADLPARSAPPPAPVQVYVPPAFTWTGFYAGATAGWNHQQNEMSGRISSPGALTGGFPAKYDNNNSVFMGGLHMGYNHQYGMYIFGGEFDFNLMSNDRHTVSRAGTGAAAGLTQEASTRLDWLSTARVRAGVTFDRMMIYGTGGLAFGAPSNRLAIDTAGTGRTHYGSSNDTRFGWTIGAGAEYALNNNLFLRAEYLYYDLGTENITAAATSLGAAGTSVTSRFKNDGHIARVGMSYRF